MTSSSSPPEIIQIAPRLALWIYEDGNVVIKSKGKLVELWYDEFREIAKRFLEYEERRDRGSSLGKKGS